nr:uncharacterized mitochondrial protein AtMg00810-like [Tanacetum cinerariifolium]
QRGIIDQTLFIRRQRGDFILVHVYVDDIIFRSLNLQLCREFEALMHEKFQMSAMGELNFFLGLQVLQKEDGIFLSQDKYVGDILKKFGYSDVRSSNTPMDKENPWGKDVKRIFRYLKGHPKLGLWYPKDSPFDLVAYSDSDYGGATQDRKSTTGGCQFLGRRLISWQCKKQTIVATSTTEAEYVAAASCYGQVLWIQNQLLDYGLSMPCETLSREISTSILRVGLTIDARLHTAKTFDLAWMWLGGIEKTDEGTKILATVDGILITVTKSSIRRNLKLNDEEGLSSLPDTELLENLTLMGCNISPNQKFTFQKGQFFHQWKFLIHTILQCLSPKSTGFNAFSSNIATALVCLATNRTYNFLKMIFDGLVKNVNSPSFSGRIVPLFDTMLIQQGEGSVIPTEPHHKPSPEAQPSSHTHISSPTLPTVITIPTVTPSETTPLRQYTQKARIAQSLALPPIADEHASPMRDVSQGEACLTDYGFVADQDRVSIAKTFTLPHESTSRVTSLAADEGTQALEITELKARVKVLEDRQGEGINLSGDDAPIKGSRLDEGEVATGMVSSDTKEIRRDEGEVAAEKVSDDTEEMATVLITMDAASVLLSGGVQVVPTAAAVAPANLLHTQGEREKKRWWRLIHPRRSRDEEIAKIHAEKELQQMIEGLDRSNETIAKHLKEYKQAVAELRIGERIELIFELVKYQDHHSKILQYQAQQRKTRTKKQKRDFYKAAIRNNLGWKVKDFKGMSFEEVEAKFKTIWEQIEGGVSKIFEGEVAWLKRKGIRSEQESTKKQKTSEEVPEKVKFFDEVPEEKIKELIRLVPIKEVNSPSFSGRIVPLINTMLIQQGEGSGTPTEPHHKPSPEAQPSSHTHISSPTLPTVITIPTVTPSETTPLRQYTRKARIAQSSALPPIADEPASPMRDVSQGEACLTDYGFVADQDRVSIAKTFTLPHESTSRVTSLAADEGSLQLPQALEITELKARVKVLEDRQGEGINLSGDDAPIKGRRLDEGEVATEMVSSDTEEIRRDEGEVAAEKVSDDTEEMATVLITMDAASVLLSGGVQVVPTAAVVAPANVSISTSSGVVPTASTTISTATPIFATSTTVIPYTRRKRKEKMIHAEKELQQMIEGLDRSNETIAKHLKEYEQAVAELTIGERIELIFEMVKYQDHHSKILQYQAQQRKTRTKKQKRDFYKAVIRNNLGWKVKDFKGMSFEEVEAKFKTIWEQIEGGVSKISEGEVAWLKRKGIRSELESTKKQKTSEEVPEKVKFSDEVPEEKIKELI